jgi:hypothetical protein
MRPDRRALVCIGLMPFHLLRLKAFGGGETVCVWKVSTCIRAPWGTVIALFHFPFKINVLGLMALIPVGGSGVLGERGWDGLQ